MEVKNEESSSIIIELSHLLSERISLGTKNRIQSILRILRPIYESFNDSHIELVKRSGGYQREDGAWTIKEKPVNFDQEYEELASVVHPITCGLIDYSKVENVESDYIYNFELLKRFFENLPEDLK